MLNWQYAFWIGNTDSGEPVFQIQGGAPEDDGGDDAGADDNDDAGADDDGGKADDDAGADDEDDYTPPTKAEWLKASKQLKKANAEAASRRHYLEEHGIDPRTGKRYDAEEDDEPEDDEPEPKGKKTTPTGPDAAALQRELKRQQREWSTKQKRSASREARLTQALVKTSVKSALADAGWNGQGSTLIDRMIVLEDVEIDDNGEIIGLDDQIAEVKAEMPDWFRVQRAKRAKISSSAASVDGGDKPGKKPEKEPKGWMQKLEEQFSGMEE